MKRFLWLWLLLVMLNSHCTLDERQRSKKVNLYIWIENESIDKGDIQMNVYLDDTLIIDDSVLYKDVAPSYQRYKEILTPGKYWIKALVSEPKVIDSFLIDLEQSAICIIGFEWYKLDSTEINRLREWHYTEMPEVLHYDSIFYKLAGPFERPPRIKHYFTTDTLLRPH